MTLNPYEAPQSMPPPPPDPHRARRWFGTFVVVMSLFLATMFVTSLGMFLTELPSAQYAPNTRGLRISVALFGLGICAGLWFAGQYFRKTGRRPSE
jgi:hypothetical protein